MGSSVNCTALPPAPRPGLWQRLRSWWAAETLSRQFWTFFTAAFFFDFGVGLYFFLFNLFLLNQHFDERAIGMITSALTLGNVAGTIPVSILVRRFGLQRLLLTCFVAAPILSIFRTTVMWMPAQIGLALLTGVALSCWPVCFAPTVAKLTTEENRVFAFSISFATGIGTGTLAGLIGGSLPGVLKSVHGAISLTSGMRMVLVAACILAMIGIWPIIRLKLGQPEKSERQKLLVFHPYLIRFLPAFAVWSIVTGSFIPFAPIFFQKHLGMSLQHVGMVFSASQLAQFCAVLIAPMLYRRAGSVWGIIVAQVIAGAAVLGLGYSQSGPLAVMWFLAYTAVQFTAGPGFYGTLMSRVPESDRSSASAAQNIVGALFQAGSAAITGILIVRYGYGVIFNANALLAGLAAVLVFAYLVPKATSRGRNALIELTGSSGS